MEAGDEGGMEEAGEAETDSVAGAPHMSEAEYVEVVTSLMVWVRLLG